MNKNTSLKFKRLCIILFLAVFVSVIAVILSACTAKNEIESINNSAENILESNIILTSLVELPENSSYELIMIDIESGEKLIHNKSSSENEINEFTPSSLIKPIIGAIGVESDSIDINDIYICDSFEEMGDAVFRCSESHGEITFAEGISKNCNTSVIEIAKKIGKDDVYNALKELHLFNELNEEIKLTDEELAFISIGQNFTVSPTKLISATASFFKNSKTRESMTCIFAKNSSNNVNGIIAGHYLSTLSNENLLCASAIAVAPLENPKVVALLIVDGVNTDFIVEKNIQNILSDIMYKNFSQ